MRSYPSTTFDNSSEDEPGLCTAGKIFAVAAVLFGIGAGIATGGAAVWLGAYAGASGLFAATIALAC